MKSDILERTEAYLDDLEKHIALKGPKGREIVDEARTDLLAHVNRYREKGKSEDEAVDLALEEMGDPAEAARAIAATIPPQSPLWLKVIRGIASLAVLGFGLLILQFFFLNSYDRNILRTLGGLAGFCFFFVPALLLWPTIVWRKNWLFGMVPAGVGFLVVMAMASLGTGATYVDTSEGGYQVTDMTVIYPEKPGQEIDRSTIQPHHQTETSWVMRGAAALTLLSTAYLICFIQRARQQRWVIGLLLGIFALFEITFRIEESKFNAILNARLDEREQKLSRPEIAPGEAEFTINWKSRWIPGYNYNYSSIRNYFWIMD